MRRTLLAGAACCTALCMWAGVAIASQPNAKVDATRISDNLLPVGPRFNEDAYRAQLDELINEGVGPRGTPSCDILGYDSTQQSLSGFLFNCTAESAWDDFELAGAGRGVCSIQFAWGETAAVVTFPYTITVSIFNDYPGGDPCNMGLVNELGSAQVTVTAGSPALLTAVFASPVTVPETRVQDPPTCPTGAGAQLGNVDFWVRWRANNVDGAAGVLIPTIGAEQQPSVGCSDAAFGVCDGLVGTNPINNALFCGIGACGNGKFPARITTTLVFGACCFDFGQQCMFTDPSTCAGLGGEPEFIGADVPCEASTCRGSCCDGSTCTPNTTLIACQNGGGFFQGIGSSCSPNPCEGACCDSLGGCLDASQADCNNVFLGGFVPDQLCATTTCPQPFPEFATTVECNGSLTVNNAGLSSMGTGGGVPSPSCLSPDSPPAAEGEFWITFTATHSSTFITTANSVVEDTILEVFTGGPDPFSLVPVPNSCGDDPETGNLRAEVCIPTTVGSDYWLLVASYPNEPGERGFITVDIVCPCPATCDTCPGDLDGDNNLTGGDIQDFTDCYIADFGGDASSACVCADIDDNDVIDEDDLNGFVDLLLNSTGLCFSGSCCYFDGESTVCEQVSQSDCETLDGNFTLGGDCSGNPCPLGRCCSNLGLTCDDVSQVECAFIGGNWTAGMNCTANPCPVQPSNDECGGAIEITQAVTPVSLSQATTSQLPNGGGDILACGDFPFNNDAINNDLWYTWTATCTGTLFLDTCGTNQDTRLAIYDADCAAILAGTLPAECNDDHSEADEGDTGRPCAFDFSASLSLPVTMGETYIIRAGSFGTGPSTMTFNINIDCVAPGNGACCLANADCTAVTNGSTECTGLGGTYQGDGTDCETSVCGGACCLANGTCDQAVDTTDCIVTRGGNFFYGVGVSCDDAFVVCPSEPGDCVHQIVLLDTFGDGWVSLAGTNTLEVFLNGVSEIELTLPDGFGGIGFIIAGNSDVITTTYTGGDTFEDENSWQILDGDGNLICEDQGGATGPSTTPMRACGNGNCP